MLTDNAIRAAKPREKAYKVFDGGGLYLLVNPNGSRWWRLKYRIAGKEKLISLGTYPATSLKDARIRRDEARLLIGKCLHTETGSFADSNGMFFPGSASTV